MNIPQPDLDDADLIEWEKKNERWMASLERQETQIERLCTEWGISRAKLDDQVSFLYEIAAQRSLDQTASNLAVIKRHPDQVDDCVALRRAAELICQQMQYFKQLSPVDAALRDAYLAAVDANGNEVERAESWTSFRNRVCKDAKTLADLADRARTKLKQDGPTKAFDPAKWRNDSYLKLLDLVQSVQLNRAKRSKSKSVSSDRAERSRFAIDLWNTFFPDTHSMTNEIEQKIRPKVPK